MTTILIRDTKSWGLKYTCRRLGESWCLRPEDVKEKLRPEMKISSDLLNIGVTQSTPCYVTEGGNALVLSYKCKSRACSISPHSQNIHSGYTARRGTSLLPTVMRRRRVCPVCCSSSKLPTSRLWNLLFVLIWFVTPSGRHFSTRIRHLSLVRVCTRIPQRIGGSKVFDKSREHTAWYSRCWRQEIGKGGGNGDK
jgi:hypothetical protein